MVGRRRTIRTHCVAPVAIGCAMVGASVMSGCQRALFPSNAPRTQFEAHDRLRNRFTPLEIPDEFGRPQPALRERLSRRR